MRAGCSRIGSALAASLAVLVGTAGAWADAFSSYQLTGSFSLPAAAPFDMLADGRLVTVAGADVYAESALGARSFTMLGELSDMDVSAYGAAFVRVSPDGTKLVIITAGEAEGGPHVSLERTKFETDRGQGAMPAPPEAHAKGISQQRQTYLEGVWSGVPTDVSADKLCSTVAPPEGATTLEFEFLRSGGVAFFDDGTEAAARGPITAASEANGVISLTFNDEVWRFRPDGKDVMYRVRSAASPSGDVDEMVFKRCKGAADRSAITLDDKALKFFAADLPGDEAFFMDERLAAKTGDRCAVQETQYLFFMLIGPAEFQLNRWNSFALAEKLAAKEPVKLPLDPIANWRIENARADGKKFVFRIRDYDNPKAVPETIHVEIKSDNSILIPEWRRTFIRCKGFQSSS